MDGWCRHCRARLPRAGWWLLAAVWLAMLWLPEGPWWSKTMLGVQSLLIAAITLRAGLLLRPQGGGALSVGAAQLRFVLWAHGLFYLAKAVSAVALDASIHLASFRGVVIQVSLVEEQVNELHDRDAGDRLLSTLSDLIRSTLPSGALAARLGGDEFVILLRDASAPVAQALGRELREAFAQQASTMFATPEPVSLSIGAALFDQADAELSHWLKRADEALYASKRQGRDRMEIVVATLAAWTH